MVVRLSGAPGWQPLAAGDRVQLTDAGPGRGQRPERFRIRRRRAVRMATLRVAEAGLRPANTGAFPFARSSAVRWRQRLWEAL